MRTSTYWKEKITWVLNNKAKYALHGEKVYFSSLENYFNKYLTAKRSERIYDAISKIKKRRNHNGQKREKK